MNCSPPLSPTSRPISTRTTFLIIRLQGFTRASSTAHPLMAPLSTPERVADYSTPPTIVADPNRRSLHRTEWIQEFFNTATSPVGHGFNLVSSNPNYHLVPADERAGFACYSFVPKSDIPLKVIVLDDTQREDDGSIDIHGHGFLDATRWAWLASRTCRWSDGQSVDDHCVPHSDLRYQYRHRTGMVAWRHGDPSTTTTNACTIYGTGYDPSEHAEPADVDLRASSCQSRQSFCIA